MNGLLKFGYLLIGASIGVFASSFVLEHELNKPIGEIEEYIPLADRKDCGDIQKDCSVDGQDSSKGEGLRRSYILSEEEFRGDDRRSGEGGSHAEFGAASTKTDLYNFYSSNEERIRNPDASRNSNEGSDTGKAEDRQQASKSDKENSRAMSERDQRREEFEARRSENLKNMSTRYSKMYKSEDVPRGGESMNDILHQVSARTDTRESYLMDHPEDDEPVDDNPFEINYHDQYNLERIEGPFEIFLDDNPRESIPLTYYAGDYTLCDDGEQIIPDPEDVVGMAALNRLIEGGPGVHDDVIFVHNTKTGINYEVMLEGGTYKESVAGLIDEKFSRE